MTNVEALALLGLVSGVLVLLGWIAWLVGRRHRDRVQGQLEIQRRIVERFADAREFTEFATSEGGRRFVESLATEHESHVERILGSIRKGAVLTLVGIGLWLVVPWNPQDLEVAGVFGTIALAVGIGYLISAYVSYRLSKGWGLLPPESG